MLNSLFNYLTTSTISASITYMDLIVFIFCSIIILRSIFSSISELSYYFALANGVTLPPIKYNTSKKATYLYFCDGSFAKEFDSKRQLYLLLGVYPSKRDALVASGELYLGYYFSDIKSDSFIAPSANV